VQSGVDLPTVKRISGHKTLIMVERYAHQNGEHIQSAMEKLQNRLNLTHQGGRKISGEKKSPPVRNELCLINPVFFSWHDYTGIT